MRRPFGQRRHQRDRRRAAADHDDALARVVKVLGPELRVDDGAGKIRNTGKVGSVAAVVPVIAGAQLEEAAGQLPFALGCRDRDGPARIVARPARRGDPLAEADMPIDPGFGGGILQVRQDRRAIRDRLLAGPRPEPIAEREHVGVGADAGIAEQVPGPAQPLAPLQDRKAAAGRQPLEMVRRADARQPGTDDDDVEMLHHASPAR